MKIILLHRVDLYTTNYLNNRIVKINKIKNKILYFHYKILNFIILWLQEEEGYLSIKKITKFNLN